MDRVVRQNERAAPLRPGDLLAHRYRILGPVGNGGLAWVWEADDLEQHRTVAIKQFKPHLGVPLAELARREARLLDSVEDTGVPRLLGKEAVAGVPCLVLEFVPGWNLQEVFDHRIGPLVDSAGWPEPGDFAVRLAAILANLHGQGFVHRDINLHNVMTRRRRRGWEPVVVDLGLGCLLDGDPACCDRLAGNLRTLAPEQIERRAIGRDPRADVYQFGLVLYRLLTGVDAFPGFDLLVERILAADFPRPREIDPSVDPALESVCLRALASDPDCRPATGRQLHGELTFAHAGCGVRAGVRDGARRRGARPGGWSAATAT